MPRTEIAVESAAALLQGLAGLEKRRIVTLRVAEIDTEPQMQAALDEEGLHRDPVDIIRRCIRGMTLNPEKVRVLVSKNTIVVRVAPEDMPRVMGPQGKAARALRTILTSVCTAQGLRFALEIQEQP